MLDDERVILRVMLRDPLLAVPLMLDFGVGVFAFEEANLPRPLRVRIASLSVFSMLKHS